MTDPSTTTAPKKRQRSTGAGGNAPLTLSLGELMSGKELLSIVAIGVLWVCSLGLGTLALFGRVSMDWGLSVSVLIGFLAGYLARPHVELVRVSHGPLGWYRVPPLPTSAVRETWRLRWNPFEKSGIVYLDIHEEGVVVREFLGGAVLIRWDQLRRMDKVHLHHDAPATFTPLKLHPKDMQRVRAIWQARTSSRGASEALP